jgi:hypothetical protein
MRGTTADETLGNVFKAYDGARTEMAKWGAVPKDAGGYKVEFDGDIAPMFSKEGLEKVTPALTKAMHAHGITDKQVPFVNTLVKELMGAGVIEKPVDVNEQWKAMAGESFRGTDEQRIQAGQAAMAEAAAFVKSFENREGWTPETIAELNLLTSSPAGVKALKLLQKGGVQQSVNTGGDGNNGAITKETLAQRRADPRNQYGNAKYDPNYAMETERQYKAFYGT